MLKAATRRKCVSCRVSDAVTGTPQACSAGQVCWGGHACGIIIQLRHAPASAGCAVHPGSSHHTAAGGTESWLWRLPSAGCTAQSAPEVYLMPFMSAQLHIRAASKRVDCLLCGMCMTSVRPHTPSRRSPHPG